MALLSNKVTSVVVLDCINSLNRLGEQSNVTLRWVPSHSGIEGNELADMLAKIGTKMECGKPGLEVGVPGSAGKMHINRWMYGC